jgi:uncharacterized protein YqeY
MATASTPPLHQLLRDRLGIALKARDRSAIGVLRCTIAAIENAEAVEVELSGTTLSQTVAGAVTGLGAAEAHRRVLSDDDIADIIGEEILERTEAATVYDDAGRTEHAERLRAEASVLTELVR